MEKGQFKEFNTLEHSERKWGWKKKNWILIRMLKGGTQRMRESAFYTKRGGGGGVLIDGWARISCQGRKLSEKSNSAWYPKDKPIPVRESFVVFRWMSFILPLAASSISKSFLNWLPDQSQTHNSNRKRAGAEAGSAFSWWTITNSTKSATNNLLVIEAGTKWKHRKVLFFCKKWNQDRWSLVWPSVFTPESSVAVWK